MTLVLFSHLPVIGLLYTHKAVVQLATMASTPSQSPIALASIAMLLVFFFPRGSLSQQPPSSIPAATAADCTPRFLALTPCAPFVQGRADSPVQSCCDNLNQLYAQQPGCLCLLLNDTGLRSFPINTSLALQLPSLCNTPFSPSTCSGVQKMPPPATPTPQVSLGTKSNSTVAASPMIQVAMGPNLMSGVFGMKNNGSKLKPEGPWMFVIVTATLAAAKLLFDKNNELTIMQA